MSAYHSRVQPLHVRGTESAVLSALVGGLAVAVAAVALVIGMWWMGP